ncbi:MAG: Ivy family c-type lysozyme inhibitor [Rhodocyclaceae bacterium]
MKKIVCALGIVLSALSAPSAQAAPPESYAGKQPQQLLKMADFSKAYRAATRDVELPAWTRRLAAGPSAQIVDIGGGKRILTSACGKGGCLDERIYVLFDPEAKSATGFFFLPPAADDPGDSRTAFSQWFGKPGKEDADFLLERAVTDAQSLNKPNH